MLNGGGGDIHAAPIRLSSVNVLAYVYVRAVPMQLVQLGACTGSAGVLLCTVIQAAVPLSEAPWGIYPATIPPFIPCSFHLIPLNRPAQRAGFFVEVLFFISFPVCPKRRKTGVSRKTPEQLQDVFGRLDAASSAEVLPQ